MSNLIASRLFASRDNLKKKTLFILGMILVAVAICLSPVVSFACGDCYSGCDENNGCAGYCGASCCEQSPTLFTHNINKSLAASGSKTVIFGWAQSGITVNQYGAKSGYGGTPITSPTSRQLDPRTGNGYLLGTEQQTDYKLSQLWIGAMRPITANCGMDWGYRVDTVYGTDARYCQSFGDGTFDGGWGSGDYYLGITQLYAELGNKQLKFKAGKFVTDMSYEPIAALGTFFYSHSYACYSSPLHVTGVVADLAVNENFSILGGWTAGYHNGFGNRFNDNGLLGKATFRPNKCMSLIYNIYLGESNGFDEQSAETSMKYGRPYNSADVLAQTLVFTWQLNNCWKYMVEGHWSSYTYKNTGFGDTTANVQGISQHLIYTLNKKLALGVRAEWYKGRAGFFDLYPVTPGEGTDIYAITLGANYYPVPWLDIRPEVRYDWTSYDGGFKPFGNGTEDDQLSAGFSFTVMF